MLEDADSEILKYTGTLSIISAREKFSSDTETAVGSLLSIGGGIF